MLKHLRSAAVMLGLMTILTGFVYPAAITAVAQAIFPYQANGSLIVKNGALVGSELLGQQFDAPNYFWGRPSATTPYPYNATASGGSNLGPTNPALLDGVKARISALRAANLTSTLPIPADLVTASASGLDPDISPAAAEYQVGRVARARGMTETAVRQLVAQNTSGRLLGIFGEPAVNVLELNLMLDDVKTR